MFGSSEEQYADWIGQNDILFRANLFVSSLKNLPDHTSGRSNLFYIFELLVNNTVSRPLKLDRVSIVFKVRNDSGTDTELRQIFFRVAAKLISFET